MKTRIRKLYRYWVVEFPFSCVVYCDTWDQAVRQVLPAYDQYLLSMERP